MCLLGTCCPCILSWFIAEKLGDNPLLLPRIILFPCYASYALQDSSKIWY